MQTSSIDTDSSSDSSGGLVIRADDGPGTPTAANPDVGGVTLLHAPPSGAFRYVGSGSVACSPEDGRRFWEAVQTLRKGMETAVAYRFPVTNDAGEVSPTTVWNNATLHGVIDDEILDAEVEISFSKFGEATPKGKWLTKGGTVRTVFDWLSRHEVGDKDGTCFMQGALVGGDRNAAAVKHQDFLVMDCDSGEPLESIHAKVRNLGVAAIVYTTHSHMKTTSEIKRDALVKWTGGDGEEDPTTSQAIDYLTDEKGYYPPLLEGAAVTAIEHTPRGVMVFVKHKPMPKARVVFILANRFSFSKGGTQTERTKEWKERYAGVAKTMGLVIDKSCTDLPRLFFTPRHPKGAPFQIDVFPGEYLDLDSMPRVTAAELRGGGDNPFSDAGSAMAGKGGGTYQTANMLQFFARHGRHFDFADFLAEVDPDGDRGSRSKGLGRTHRCPNDDMHTDAGNPEDKGFFCVNALDSETEQAVAKCMHSSCADLDRTHFVDLACQAVGIKDAMVLVKWVPELVGDEEEVDASVTKPFGNYDEFKIAFEALGQLATAQDHAGLVRRVGASAWTRNGALDDVWSLVKKPGRLRRESYDQAVEDGRIAARAAKCQESSTGCRWLPGSFGIDDGWIFQHPEKIEEKPVRVCKVFEPTSLVRDGDNAKWKLTIAFDTPDAVRKTFLVDFGTLVSEGHKVIAEMMSSGFQMRTGRTEIEAIKRLLGDMLTSGGIARSVLCDKPGWQAGGRYYVTPTGAVCGAAPTGEAVTLAPGARFESIAKGGTLEEQKALLAEVVRGCIPDSIKAGQYEGDADRGMFHLLLGIGAGLVGPAATLLPAEEGGGIVIVGDSGKGKTTALELGASLWGSPKAKEAALIESAATGNGLEIPAGRATANFLALNELKHVKKPHETLSPMLFRLAGGQGTLRMKQDASGNRATNTWRLFCAASSEKTLAELIRGEVVDGLYARFPEIMLGDAPRLDASHPFLAVLKRHHVVYGHIAEAYVERLIEAGYNSPEGLDRLSRDVDAIWSDLSAKMPAASRALRKLAWIAWTLDRMVEWGFLPVDTPIDWAIKMAAESAVEGGAGEAFSGGREMDLFKTNVALFATNRRIVSLRSPGDNGEDDKWENPTNVFGARDVVGWMWPDPQGTDKKMLIVVKDQLAQLVPGGKTAAGVAGLLCDAGLLVPKKRADLATGRSRDLVHEKHGMKGKPPFKHYKFVLPAEMLDGSVENEEA